ncbi:type I-E CRISPR-associated protein Cas5/CasD [Candidatus Methylospira mobilis]|uniref:Type I-E CRISPR-associated protein Cas5/CasD n=1 Tax=Candidatus Methylospira mobilis TaxID=1808979 RepID=A0A5Q0BBN3_9GAMM|nr:type I-E CRISPR-associated protein Cas5/CasD [Candidatus Methylospira mobilis]QFY41335.1 type I-E CRISPR-associated protein Cas5/CasD [Candidatus Methylospira mobilis]WNV05437.1 type I-E CRISPR-associated protein Cas5/CasD [Candidatus Methylospira mobilis]
METLVFQLQAPLSSWGDVAVGEYRPSAEYPSQSAIQGLLGAALGIVRDDDAAQTSLRTGYRLAVGVLSQGRLLRDYHTAQVPGRSDLKKRPHSTRRDELSLPKTDLNTILSSRDYRQDAAALVAVQTVANAPYSLTQLAEALKKPKFVLYLGRKSCPVAAPVYPRVLSALTINAAFTEYLQQLADLWRQQLPKYIEPNHLAVQKIAWSDDFGTDDLSVIGVQRNFSITRKDQVITRQGWQFADRNEHIALLMKG